MGLTYNFIQNKILVLLILLVSVIFADNPIVQTNFTPDPAVLVYRDTLYLHTGQDEDITVNNFFTMHNYRVYSTTDMVNWTDRGSPLSYRTFSWAGDKAWAAQCIERNGRFYWYVTVGLPGGQPTIGVAVADHPAGPFRDAIGAPLIRRSWDDIDPTVFVDSDGQAYMYWGNPKLYFVRLNSDMISFSGGIQEIPMTTQSFGTRTGDAGRPTLYEEGPWFYRRGNLYYMIFAAGPLPETIGYSTSPGPTGPWTYRGKVMSATNTNSFTNHPAMVDFRGRSYFFYHTGHLPGGGGFKRSSAVEEFVYAADGSIPLITPTTQGPAPIATLDPFRRVQAETIAFSNGLKSAENTQVGVYITNIDNNDFIKVSNLDFGTGGTARFLARVASGGAGGVVEIRLGSTTGTLLGSLQVAPTGGPLQWRTDSVAVTSVTGIRDLFLVFRGGNTGNLFNIDYWQFRPQFVIPASRDSVFNGTFTNGNLGWTLNVWSGRAQGAVENGTYRLTVDSIGEHPYQIQLIQNGIILEQGKSYELSFDARSASPRTLQVNVELDVSPWTSYLAGLQTFNINTSMQRHSFVFTMAHATDSNSRIAFNAGASVGNIFLDNVRIVQSVLTGNLLKPKDPLEKQFKGLERIYDLQGRVQNHRNK